MRIVADLHLHTDRSDGLEPPARVIRRVHEAGVPVAAITDHDTIAGLSEAGAEAARLGVRLVAGVELSVAWAGQDVHILGYFLDPGHPGLCALLETLRRAREERLAEMLARLRKLGIPIDERQVFAEAPRGGPVGRPHIATALVRAGWVGTFDDAFRYLIGGGAPAYLPNRTPVPEEALGVLLAAGGVPILAHPTAYDLAPVLERFVPAGLMGLEAVHPSHDAEASRRLARIAAEQDLLIAGGSDYHGSGRGEALPGRAGIGKDAWARLEAGRLRVPEVWRRRHGRSAP